MKNRGDTIVEVIIAFAMFSLIAVTAFSIMNRGLALAQNSLEISLVRAELDSQADMLRYIRNSNNDQDRTLWQNIRSRSTTTSLLTTEQLLNDGCPVAMPDSAFALASSGSGLQLVNQYEEATMYSGVVKNDDGAGSTAYGLWVQATPAEGAAGAYDMHIRACWYSAGRDRPETLATIVRLYET